MQIMSDKNLQSVDGKRADISLEMRLNQNQITVLTQPL